MTTIKLTAMQARELEALAYVQGLRLDARVGNGLREKGLAEGKTTHNEPGIWLRITPAGRAWLAANKREGQE